MPKISELTAVTSVATTDLVPVVQTAGAANNPKKATIAQMIASFFTNAGANVLALVNGGTGASTAANARTNLGVPAVADLQNQQYTYFTTGGTSTAYTLTPTPALFAYTAGFSYYVTFNAASGTSPTLTISGLASPPNLVRQNYDGTYSNIASGEIPANHRSRVTLISATQALVEELPPAINFSGRNKVRNGGMDIAQRGASFLARGLVNTYTLDGWLESGIGTTSVVDVTQQGDAPADNEFQNSLRVAVTTADAAVAAGDLVYVYQPIEGYLVRDLIGQPVAISFRVRSSKTGIHCVAIRNSGADRSYVMEYTVNVANTWETKTLAIPVGLITAGTWNWTTGLGATLSFALMAGSTYQTAKDAWQIGNFLATANQVNCMDTIGNIFAITGVQLEKGAQPTPFEHRDLMAELALNQRYYEKSYDLPTVPGTVSSVGCMHSAVLTAFILHCAAVRYETAKRVPGTITVYSTQNGTAANASEFNPGSVFVADRAMGTSNSGCSGFEINAGGAATAGNYVRYQWAASAEI